MSNTRFTVGDEKGTSVRHTFRAETSEYQKGSKDTSLANDYWRFCQNRQF